MIAIREHSIPEMDLSGIARIEILSQSIWKSHCKLFELLSFRRLLEDVATIARGDVLNCM
jgi:hypothetical protein